MAKQEPAANHSRIRRERKDGGVDQRQQQIDPAGQRRQDVNANSKDSMKQPGNPSEAPAKTGDR